MTTKAQTKQWVRFYKNGDHFGIKTNAGSKDDFLELVSKELSALIDNEQFKHDWQFQLSNWLPMIVEMANALEGMESRSERVFECGVNMVFDDNWVTVTPPAK